MDVASLIDYVSIQPRYSRFRRWAEPFAYSVASMLALAIDVPVAALLKQGIPRFFGEFLENCETFGNGHGVALILIAVVVLDRVQARAIPWLMAGSLGSGLVSNILKLTVDRMRPRDFDFAMTSVWDTFQRVSEGSRGSQSMPSSHTATAVGLAILLSALYPQGRWYFAVLAALVGIQRMATLAHYPSDVFAGAAIGSMIGMWAVASMDAKWGRTDVETSNGSRPVGSTD